MQYVRLNFAVSYSFGKPSTLPHKNTNKAWVFYAHITDWLKNNKTITIKIAKWCEQNSSSNRRWWSLAFKTNAGNFRNDRPCEKESLQIQFQFSALSFVGQCGCESRTIPIDFCHRFGIQLYQWDGTNSKTSHSQSNWNYWPRFINQSTHKSFDFLENIIKIVKMLELSHTYRKFQGT